jgi:hypothetical protein
VTKKKPGPKPGEPTTMLRVTVRAQRRVKRDAKQLKQSMVMVASERLLADLPMPDGLTRVES